MCASCRELRGCFDVATPQTAEMRSRHARPPSSQSTTASTRGIPRHRSTRGIRTACPSPGARPHREDSSRVPAGPARPAEAKEALRLQNAAHKMVLGEGAQPAVLDLAVHGLKADGKPADKPRGHRELEESRSGSAHQVRRSSLRSRWARAAHGGKVFQNPLRSTPAQRR